MESIPFNFQFPTNSLSGNDKLHFVDIQQYKKQTKTLYDRNCCCVYSAMNSIIMSVPCHFSLSIFVFIEIMLCIDFFFHHPTHTHTYTPTTWESVLLAYDGLVVLINWQHTVSCFYLCFFVTLNILKFHPLR